MLLKGPAIARWLYSADELRSYGDVDLLVAPGEHRQAEACLRGLGFVRFRREYEQGRRIEHDSMWVRTPGPAVVDLHITLPRLRGVSPEAAWRRLRPLTEEAELPPPGGRVRILDETARTLLVALHAAHHVGYEGIEAKPLEDLRRALERVEATRWERATELARALHAEPQLARGLHAVPGGAALARSLGLPPPSSERNEAAGFERLHAAANPRARMEIIVRALAPPPSYLRWASPLARRGGAGLLAAYLVRPLLMAAHLPRGFRTWRRTRGATPGEPSAR